MHNRFNFRHCLTVLDITRNVCNPVFYSYSIENRITYIADSIYIALRNPVLYRMSRYAITYVHSVSYISFLMIIFLQVVLVRGHYVSYLPLCSRNEPVFLAVCTPLAMPETRECVVHGATNVFTTVHAMDMKILHIDAKLVIPHNNMYLKYSMATRPVGLQKCNSNSKAFRRAYIYR